MNKAERIKESVNALDVCQRYGVPVNRAGFASCLWHQEKTPSMKVYDGKGGVHCYGCGKSGSVIDLTMRIHGLDFPDACRKLDQDFGLHLYDEPYHERKKSRGELLEEAKRDYTERRERRKREERLKALETALNDAEIEVANLSRQINAFDPKHNSGVITSQYADAVRKIPVALYNADEAERELYDELGIGKKSG